MRVKLCVIYPVKNTQKNQHNYASRLMYNLLEIKQFTYNCLFFEGNGNGFFTKILT